MKQQLYSQPYSEKSFRKEQPFIINRSTILLLLLLVIGLISSLPVDAQDILTGLTSNGGPDGMGTAFSIKSTGANFSIMKTFADWGKAPYKSLLLGSDGNYYGRTSTGGTYNNGIIFKMIPAGAMSTHTFNAPVNGRVELNASQLSRGMYLLQIETGSGKQILKYIKE